MADCLWSYFTLWSINLWHQDYGGCDIDACALRRMLHFPRLVAVGDSWVQSWGTHIPAGVSPSVLSFIERTAPATCVSAHLIKKHPLLSEVSGFTSGQKGRPFWAVLGHIVDRDEGGKLYKPYKTTFHTSLCYLFKTGINRLKDNSVLYLSVYTIGAMLNNQLLLKTPRKQCIKEDQIATSSTLWNNFHICCLKAIQIVDSHGNFPGI